MNLPHWIDQHPAAFGAIFPIYFLCLWFLVAAIISFVGGWFSLAKGYRMREPFNGAKWRMQSGQMRWRVNYNNVLTIGASPEGLYLASMFLFRFMLYPPRFVVNLRCRLLSLLRIHSPNCEVCNAREKYGVEMRQRLEELNWRTEPDSPANGNHGEVVEVFDSKPGEVVASLPISLKAQRKKIA
jgi:hypothetical protein